jgi:tetratricopeptide (TPR) repeat protein
LDEAVVEFRKAVELDPKRAEFRSNLGGMLYNRLHTQGKLGRGEGLAEAVAELRTAIQLDPKSAHAHFNLANCLLSQRKLDAAVAEYRKAISLKQDYIEAYCHLAAALVEQGRYQEAETALGGALRLNPALAQIPNSFAWRLANAQGPKRRGGRQAVAFAELAVKAAPNNGKFWNTLGAAHYRAGNWKEAVTALEKSMQLRQGGDGFDWFFLAMAHWQLGDRDKARQWFDRAVQWLDKYQPRNEELGRFRAEAAALLGGKEKP